jgi:hypothetical protein
LVSTPGGNSGYGLRGVADGGRVLEAEAADALGMPVLTHREIVGLQICNWFAFSIGSNNIYQHPDVPRFSGRRAVWSSYPLVAESTSRVHPVEL